MKKVLHLGNIDKFIAPFIFFNEENFKSEKHEYMFYGYDESLIKVNSVKLCRNKIIEKIFFYPKVFKAIKESDLVIMHSLNNKVINLFFFVLNHSLLLKKVYWVMWGGDLYGYKNKNKKLKDKRQNFYKKTFLPNIGGMISYLPGDFDLAELWYGCKGRRCECLAYQSNIYKAIESKSKNEKKVINILVGNSSDPSNNHKEVFGKIKYSNFDNYVIFCPLSYGNKKYQRDIIEYGYEMFGDKFKPITKNICFDDYNIFLSSIDIAMFNHDRQQAMGTTISLLGFGVPVYLRVNTSQWRLFEEKGIKVYPVDQFGLDEFRSEKILSNIYKVESYFSKENLIAQWDEIYKYE